MRTSLLGGAEYTAELLESGHDRRIIELVRMDKPTFNSLVSWERENQQLNASKSVQPTPGYKVIYGSKYLKF